MSQKKMMRNWMKARQLRANREREEAAQKQESQRNTVQHLRLENSRMQRQLAQSIKLPQAVLEDVIDGAVHDLARELAHEMRLPAMVVLHMLSQQLHGRSLFRVSEPITIDMDETSKGVFQTTVRMPEFSATYFLDLDAMRNMVRSEGPAYRPDEPITYLKKNEVPTCSGAADPYGMTDDIEIGRF